MENDIIGTSPMSTSWWPKATSYLGKNSLEEKNTCGRISFQVFHFSTITYRYAWLVWDPHQNNGKNSWNSGIFGAWWNHICNHQTPPNLVTRCLTLPIKYQSLRSSVNKNLQLPRCFIHPTTFHSSIQFLGKLVPKPEFKGILVGCLY